jgi:hypothetical protein
VRDVPANPVRVNVDDVEWEIKVMGAETYQVPLNVYHIILAAEEHNVPFGYYLWGEEQFQRPMFVPSRWLVRFRISTIEAGDIAQMQRLWPPCSGSFCTDGGVPRPLQQRQNLKLTNQR